jgi:hypothetical protein
MDMKKREGEREREDQCGKGEDMRTEGIGW